MALTSTPSFHFNYLFSALTLISLTSAIILIELGTLQYLLDSYQPARLTSISEVIAAPERSSNSGSRNPLEVEPEDDRFTRPTRPVSRLARNTGSRVTRLSQASQSSESEIEENRLRWGAQWALCAVAANLGISVLVAAAMSLIGQLGEHSVDCFSSVTESELTSDRISLLSVR